MPMGSMKESQVAFQGMYTKIVKIGLPKWQIPLKGSSDISVKSPQET